MALELYDHESPVNFAYRGELSRSQIADDPALAPMLTEETVLYTNGEGKVYDFRYLSVLVGIYANQDEETGSYDIDTSDPEAALAEIIKRMNVPPITLDDVVEGVSDVAAIAAENSEVITDSQTSIEELYDAVAELGALVGGE